MKKILLLIGLCIILSSLTYAAACPPTQSGDGTVASPCVITNCTQLQNMSMNLSASFALGNNIDCSDTINWDGGAGFLPVALNGGSLDGKGYNISELVINRGATSNVGLFSTPNNFIIQNISLNDVNIVGNDFTGALIGKSGLGTSELYDIGISGNVSGAASSGGIGGRIDSAATNLSRMFFKGNVNCTDHCGGIFSDLTGCSTCALNNSYFKGNVHTDTNVAGGILGNPSGTLHNSYATGNVWGQYAGGLVGNGGGGVTNCFSDVYIYNSTEYGGGISGYLVNGIITSSYYQNNQNYPCQNGIFGGGSENNCTAVNIPNYFKGDVEASPPMSSWSFFDIWQEMETDYPVLTWQGVGADYPLPASPRIQFNDPTPENNSVSKNGEFIINVSTDVDISLFDDTTIVLYKDGVYIGAYPEYTQSNELSGEGLEEASVYSFFADLHYTNGTTARIGPRFVSIFYTVNLSIDNQLIFNYSVNGTNTTDDFSSQINSYLETCVPENDGNCLVPIKINTPNTTTLDAINITYDLNVTELYNYNGTLFWNQTTDVIPHKELKRRYLVGADFDNVSNNISLRGYYNNFTATTQCEVNNTAYEVTADGYCNINFTVLEGTKWPNHYIWEDTITNAVGIVHTNKTTGVKDYQRISLTTGTNYFSILGNHSNLPQNKSLGIGYNLLGCSNKFGCAMSDLYFINSTGNRYTYEEAVLNGKLKEAEDPEQTLNLTFVNPNDAFWLYSNEQGQIEFPQGTPNTTTYTIDNLYFTDGTTEYNITDAVDEGWVSNPSDLILNRLIADYYDNFDEEGSPTGSYEWLSTGDFINSFVGYRITANQNVDLILKNYESLNKITQEDNISYYDTDNSEASAGTFTNTTIEYYYNSEITSNQKLEYHDETNDIWYDITPTPVSDCITSPTYTKKTAAGKTFWVCLDTTNKYISYKIDSSS